MALSLSAPRLEKKKAVCFIPVNLEWTELYYDKDIWVIFWVMSMDLATEVTGGWGCVCSAPGQGSNLLQNQLQRWEDFCR